MTFTSLGLHDDIVRAAAYAAPTPIQRAAIPAILNGKDVWASAHTGSGKTAAFALPILQRNLHAASGSITQALIVVPTRELAAQVAAAFRHYARFLPRQPKIVAAFGGVSMNPQQMALRGGADIIVATPGRLLALADCNAVRLHALTTLVLDEADRLLDLGFAEELSQLLALLPRERQNLLFSATFPVEVEALASALLRDPVRLGESAMPVPAAAIEQRAVQVDSARRTQLLRHLIRVHQWERVLVFTATRHSTQHVAEKLRRAGIAAAALHGELSQGARTQALADFKARKLAVIVATDLAARGIDIVQLPAVVNYDLPRSADDYIHRIGRTGRAGLGGTAVSFVTAQNESHFRLIEKRQGMRLQRERIAGFEPAAVEATAESATGGIKGKRQSKKDKLRAAAADASPAAQPSVWRRR